jgi:small subunit ribosomal protein S15
MPDGQPSSGRIYVKGVFMAVTKERKAELIKQYGKNEKDSGSAAVQVALLTERIKGLTEHVKFHKHDHHTRRGLLMLVGQRRRLLSYIKKQDIEEYRSLIKSLGIRDNIQ